MIGQFIELEAHGDSRGKLVSIESSKNIPFNIERVYYIFDTSLTARRGYHAHKDLEQLLVCISGSCMIHLDDGYSSKEVTLDSPTRGLLIKSNVWREMYDFCEGTVLLVLASHKYDPDDYIRDYQLFMKMVEDSKE